MQFNAMIEGLTILSQVANHDDFVSAEHDILYACQAETSDRTLVDSKWSDEYAIDERLSDEDNARLHELGWHIDTDTESWAHYC